LELGGNAILGEILRLVAEWESASGMRVNGDGLRMTGRAKGIKTHKEQRDSYK